MPPDTEYVIPDAVLAELDIDQDVTVRVRSMQDLTQVVRSQRLQGHAVELLWVKVQDLAKGCEQNEARRECWNFLAIDVGAYLPPYEYTTIYHMRDLI